MLQESRKFVNPSFTPSGTRIRYFDEISCHNHELRPILVHAMKSFPRTTQVDFGNQEVRFMTNEYGKDVLYNVRIFDEAGTPFEQLISQLVVESHAPEPSYPRYTIFHYDNSRAAKHTLEQLVKEGSFFVSEDRYGIFCGGLHHRYGPLKIWFNNYAKEARRLIRQIERGDTNEQTTAQETTEACNEAQQSA